MRSCLFWEFEIKIHTSIVWSWSNKENVKYDKMCVKWVLRVLRSDPIPDMNKAQLLMKGLRMAGAWFWWKYLNQSRLLQSGRWSGGRLVDHLTLTDISISSSRRSVMYILGPVSAWSGQNKCIFTIVSVCGGAKSSLVSNVGQLFHFRYSCRMTAGCRM